MKKLIVLIILTINLSSCGGGDNNTTSNNVKTILEGNWLISCYALDKADLKTSYAIHTVSFTNNKFTSIGKTYSDSSCTILFSISELNRTVIGSFIIGEKTTTSNGLLAYEIDIHNENVNGISVDNYGYSIFRIDQNFLYSGTASIGDKNNGTTPTLRHNKLKLINYHVRQ